MAEATAPVTSAAVVGGPIHARHQPPLSLLRTHRGLRPSTPRPVVLAEAVRLAFQQAARRVGTDRFQQGSGECVPGLRCGQCCHDEHWVRIALSCPIIPGALKSGGGAGARGGGRGTRMSCRPSRRLTHQHRMADAHLPRAQRQGPTAQRATSPSSPHIVSKSPHLAPDDLSGQL
jgi:hypothetical protein